MMHDAMPRCVKHDSSTGEVALWSSTAVHPE